MKKEINPYTGNMKTLFKIIILTAFTLFIGAKCFDYYKRLNAWANEPTEEQIKAQYQRVGY